MDQYDAFVSYSHADAELVKPIVEILGRGRNVFWDDDIKPGERWMDRIGAALAGAKEFNVIWCCHSAESRYVHAEIEQAFERKKRVVPILICPYPLREPLDEVQGIDMSRGTRHPCLNDHRSGDMLEHEDARELVMTQFAPDSKNPEATVNDWLRKSMTPKRTMPLFAAISGAMLILLAVLQPFASNLTPRTASLVNAAVGVIGALVGMFGLRRATRRVVASPQSLLLAAVIETLIRQTERGEKLSRRRLKVT